MSQVQDVTYRNIAKMLAKALPIEGEEFGSKVEENIATIKKLPKTARIALRSAFIFGSKVPSQEREDMFQDISLAILKARVTDERLAYAIARCDWRDWWGKYRIRQHYSLDSVIESDDGNPTTLGELIVGEAEFETKMNGKLDGERIWNALPDCIKPIIQSRLLGKALNATDRQRLSRWVRKDGYKLLIA